MLARREEGIPQRQEIDCHHEQRAESGSDPTSAAQRVPCLRGAFRCFDEAHVVRRRPNALNHSRGKYAQCYQPVVTREQDDHRCDDCRQNGYDDDERDERRSRQLVQEQQLDRAHERKQNERR